MNVFQRCNAVRNAVAYVQKDKKVEGYMAVTHDVVTALLRPAMVEHEVFTIVQIVEGVTVLTGTQTKSGTPIIRFEGVFDVFFVNGAEGMADSFKVRVSAHANDHGDKAPGKATSYALKTALLKTFNLESGEDDEGRIEAEPTTISSGQLIELRAHVEKLRYPVDETLRALAEKVYSLKDIAELRAEYFDDAIRRLDAKAAARDAKEKAEAK